MPGACPNRNSRAGIRTQAIILRSPRASVPGCTTIPDHKYVPALAGNGNAGAEGVLLRLMECSVSYLGHLGSTSFSSPSARTTRGTQMDRPTRWLCLLGNVCRRARPGGKAEPGRRRMCGLPAEAMDLETEPEASSGTGGALPAPPQLSSDCPSLSLPWAPPAPPPPPARGAHLLSAPMSCLSYTPGDLPLSVDCDSPGHTFPDSRLSGQPPSGHPHLDGMAHTSTLIPPLVALCLLPLSCCPRPLGGPRWRAPRLLPLLPLPAFQPAASLATCFRPIPPLHPHDPPWFGFACPFS